jgi:hypothetical protein
VYGEGFIVIRSRAYHVHTQLFGLVLCPLVRNSVGIVSVSLKLVLSQ